MYTTCYILNVAQPHIILQISIFSADVLLVRKGHDHVFKRCTDINASKFNIKYYLLINRNMKPYLFECTRKAV